MNQNNKEFNPIGIVQDPISFDKTEEIKTVEDVKVADTKIVNEYKEESKQVVEPEVEQQPVVTQTETPVKQSNTCATVGFVFSLLGFSIIPLILCIIGLNKSKEVNKGKGLSIAGILIVIIRMAVIILCLVLFTSFFSAILGLGSSACSIVTECTSCNSLDVCTCKYTNMLNEEETITCPKTDKLPIKSNIEQVEQLTKIEDCNTMLTDIAEGKYYTDLTIKSCGYKIENYEVNTMNLSTDGPVFAYKKMASTKEEGKELFNINDEIKVSNSGKEVNVEINLTKYGATKTYRQTLRTEIIGVKYYANFEKEINAKVVILTIDGIFLFEVNPNTEEEMYFEKISGENKYVDVVYTSETEASNEVIKLFFIDEENKVYDIEGQEIQSDPNTYYCNIIKGYDIMVDRTIKSVKDTLPFKFSNLFEEYKLDGKGAMLFIDSNKKLHTNEGESKYKVLKVCKLDGKADILIMEDGSEYVGYLK